MPSMQVTNVPLQSAVSIKQSDNRGTMRFSASERIGEYGIGGPVSNTATSVFMLNPTSLPGTRLAAMAKLYQRFRFTSAELTVNANLSSATTGSIVAGFSSNPDLEVGTNSLAQIYSLPGAKSARLWVPTHVKASMAPLIPGGWYIIDRDSAEIMLTSQGKFLIDLETKPNLETYTTIPILLSYTIEFSLPIAPTEVSTSHNMPAMSWSGSDGSSFTALTANLSEFGVPTTKAKTVYAMIPSQTITVGSGLGAPEDVDVHYVYQATPSKFYLYPADGLANALNVDLDAALHGFSTDNWNTPRVTWYAVQ